MTLDDLDLMVAFTRVCSPIWTCGVTGVHGRGITIAWQSRRFQVAIRAFVISSSCVLTDRAIRVRRRLHVPETSLALLPTPYFGPEREAGWYFYDAREFVSPRGDFQRCAHTAVDVTRQMATNAWEYGWHPWQA